MIYVTNPRITPIWINCLLYIWFQATLLLGGAVLLSAIGIIGTTDFEKLKSNKKKKCESDSKLKNFGKRLEKIENNLEGCCDVSGENKKYLQFLCIFVSKFVISPIEICIKNFFSLIHDTWIYLIFQANQLGGNEIEFVDCEMTFDQTGGTQDLCSAVNQIIRRLNAIKSPTFCHGFGSGSISFGSKSVIGKRVKASQNIIYQIQRRH